MGEMLLEVCETALDSLDGLGGGHGEEVVGDVLGVDEGEIEGVW